MTLKRTEQIHIKHDINISSQCHYAKNLYNEANYYARQRFFNYHIAPNYDDMDKLMNGKANESSENYDKLPAKTAQWVLKTVTNNWLSFFRSIKDWKKHPGKYLGMPRPPKYLKKDGEFVLIFTSQQIRIIDEYIHFPKKMGIDPIKTRITAEINQVRIVPKGVGYTCEIVYEKNNIENIISSRWYNNNKNRIIGIDPGVNNIVAIVNNIGERPIIIKGGILKSCNQFYNKEIGRLNSIKDKQGIVSSTRLQKSITNNRNNRIKDQMHKISRFVVDYCIDNDIGTIVIGKNDGWKQDVGLGKTNNQNFVSIPHARLIQMIEYKAEEIGVDVICNEESYTSKCSFLDNEKVCKHSQYLGNRISRGLFQTAKGIIVNADVNAGYNIIRKAIPTAFVNGIEGLALIPVSVKLTNGAIKQNVI